MDNFALQKHSSVKEENTLKNDKRNSGSFGSRYSPYGSIGDLEDASSIPAAPSGASSREVSGFLPHRQIPIEPNLSFARGYGNGDEIKDGSRARVRTGREASELPRPTLAQYNSSTDPDEDEKFLSMAREALVATASNARSEKGSLIIDPTIQDLLCRLQYASSPHGNPIREGSKIQTNENGQLMIQDFYNNFPNFSKDIFASPPDIQEGSAPSARNNGMNSNWNFLVGEPFLSNRQSALGESSSGTLYDNSSDFQHERRDSRDEDRKFLCSICSMSFRRSSDLKRHEKQHLSIPPNICEMCGKGFARKDALKRHLGTLTCKRNAEKKLYIENLTYLHESQKKKGR